ncbi:putative single-stranded DNA-binding protein [Bacillus phage vB_BsuM-Goe9]|nr:putative single-stranded DNA-binding protein [Bacillus phage vB_BsuM-Goe9]
MAFNMDKLKEKLEGLSNNSGGNQGPTNQFVKIEDGKNRIRLLPAGPGREPEEFYEEVWVHYGVGKNSENKNGTMVVCPKSRDENAKCPVCELSKQYKDLSKKKDDKYHNMAKDIYRKKRVYFNAIPRSLDLDDFELNEDGKWINTKEEDREESPIKVLGVGIGVFKEILKLVVDPEYGEDLVKIEGGLDITITKEGSGRFNTTYSVAPARKESDAFPEDEAPKGLAEKFEEYLNDLAEFSNAKSYDEIADLLDGGNTDPDDEDEDEEEEEKPKKNKKNKKSKKVKELEDEEEEDDSEDSEDEEDDDEDEDDDLDADIKAAMARKKRKK